jgi:flagellar basal-body rod modification protein FlgD
MTIPSTSAIANANATATTNAADAGLRTTKQALGQDDFLKLLAVQFQSQDPMKPTEDTAFIAQMAQFTSLDQTSSLVQQMTQMRTDQQLSTANGYIGRQVTFSTGEDTTATGTVSAVDMTGSSPQLIVNGTAYPLSSVLYVEAAPTPATPAATNEAA